MGWINVLLSIMKIPSELRITPRKPIILFMWINWDSNEKLEMLVKSIILWCYSNKKSEIYEAIKYNLDKVPSNLMFGLKYLKISLP